MSIAKNPYEIRSELLNLAQEILLRKFEAEAIKEYNSKIGDPKKSAEDNVVIMPYLGSTRSPTTEEIITEAKKLNDFISNDRK